MNRLQVPGENEDCENAYDDDSVKKNKKTSGCRLAKCTLNLTRNIGMQPQ